MRRIQRLTGSSSASSGGSGSDVTRSSFATSPAAAPAGKPRSDAGQEGRDAGHRAAQHRDLANLPVRVQAEPVGAGDVAALDPALPEEGVRVAVLELVHHPQLLERLDDAAIGVGHDLAPLEGRVCHGRVEDDVRGERVDQCVDVAGGHGCGERVAHDGDIPRAGHDLPRSRG